jgi:hypothetical protein
MADWQLGFLNIYEIKRPTFRNDLGKKSDLAVQNGDAICFFSRSPLLGSTRLLGPIHRPVVGATRWAPSNTGTAGGVHFQLQQLYGRVTRRPLEHFVIHHLSRCGLIIKLTRQPTNVYSFQFGVRNFKMRSLLL